MYKPNNDSVTIDHIHIHRLIRTSSIYVQYMILHAVINVNPVFTYYHYMPF